MERGFTLIEILIVVVLLSIVALVVLPSGGENDDARLAAAGRILIADLEFAQLASIGNGVDPCVVVFDTTNERYHLARDSAPSTPMTSPASNDPYETTFGEGRAHWLAGVELDEVAVGGDDALGFTHLGSLDQTTAATITLRSGAETLVISVDADTGEPSTP